MMTTRDTGGKGELRSDGWNCAIEMGMEMAEMPATDQWDGHRAPSPASVWSGGVSR